MLALKTVLPSLLAVLITGPFLLVAQPSSGHPLAGLAQLKNCWDLRDLQAKP